MILVFFEATEQFLTGATPALSSGDEASVLAVRLLFEYIAHPHATQRCAGVGVVAFQSRPTGQFGIGQCLHAYVGDVSPGYDRFSYPPDSTRDL